MTDRPPVLSQDANKLLMFMNLNCKGRANAKSDAIIARTAHLSQRSIIELADELLRHGRIVIAEVTAPMGRWLLPQHPTNEELAAAWNYLSTLQNRAKKIFVRAQHLKSAIEKTEQHRRIDSVGQGRLFSTQPSQPSQPTQRPSQPSQPSQRPSRFQTTDPPVKGFGTN